MTKSVFIPPQTARPFRRRRRTETRGRGLGAFTLVEVMTAAAILGLGIASAFLCLRSGLNSLDTARTTSVVAQVLQNEAERVRLLNWEAVQSLPPNVVLSLPPQFEKPSPQETDSPSCEPSRTFQVIPI